MSGKTTVPSFSSYKGCLQKLPWKYIDELKHLWNTGQLEFHGTAEKYRNYYVFKDLLDSCYDTEWIPYCKKTFNGAGSVIDYLGSIPTGLPSAITASSVWTMKTLLFL